METLLPGGCHKGQLTLLGQEQARALGSWLRHRYATHLQLLEPELKVRIMQQLEKMGAEPYHRGSLYHVLRT